MKYLIYLIFIFIIFGANLAFNHMFGVRVLVPTLIFLLVLNFAVNRTSYDFFFIAVCCGLLLDLYSRSPVGSFSFPLLVFAFILHVTVNWFAVLEIDWKFTVFVSVLGLGLVYGAIWVYSLISVSARLTQYAVAFQPRFSVLLIEISLCILATLPFNFFVDWFKLKTETILSNQQVIR